MILPCANAESMNLHLKEVSLCVTPGAHAVVLLDGAGWHIANDLEVPENITLFPIPPYSPELNPVENIWEFLRGNKLAIQVWDDYEAIVNSCCDAWNWLMGMPERITSIASRKWAQPVNI
ncbi:conserved hypothetical protein [uncultured Gammaproteobacteria bacterium]